MLEHEFAQVGLACLVDESFLVEEEVVAHTAADVAVAHALDGIDGAVELEHALVRAVQVRAGAREETGLPAAFRAQVRVLAVQAVHVGRRRAEVGDVAVEFGHGRQFADFLQDGALAARLDEFALVSGDRAEVATAEAASVRDDRVLDHVVRRNALTLVAGVRKFGERQVPAGVHLLGRGGRIGRIHLHVAVADGLDERLRVKHIRLNLYFMEILSKRNLILATLFERM